MELSFWKHATENPNHVALIDADGGETTAAELHAASNQIVHGLRALGLEPGDAIATLLHNSREMVELVMAATQAGWYITPINWHLTAPEIQYIAEDCGAKAIFCSDRFGKAAETAVNAMSFPKEARFAVGEIAGFTPYDSLKSGQPSTPPTDRTAGSTMTYTSGTTGRPKGVRRPTASAPPEAVSTQLAMFLALFGMMPGSEGVHLAQAPLYHTAVVNFVTSHLHLGHRIVLIDKWTGEGVLQAIETYKVTNSHMVPTQFNRLLKLPDEVKQKYDVSSLSHIIHSAAPCPIATKHAMLEWWGPCVYEYYAASEGGGTLATPDAWLKKPGTVGSPWPISQIKILDEEQNELPVGDVGTVWIKMGDHRFEYHKDKEKTGKAWSEGFFTVGDAGYVDEDGFLFLCDRKADMIISGGVNIYPAEIESVYIMHPKVADVAVFGIPNDDWGEEVKAVIQPAEGVETGAALVDELTTYASERLAKYKRPKTIDFIDELPRDPNGKLYKRKLRDPYWEGRDRAI